MAHTQNRYESVEIGKRKLEKLYEETKNGYGAGAWKDDNGHIKKYWVCPNARRWLKRCCSKAARKSKNIANGSAYKKAFDYWWSLT